MRYFITFLIGIGLVVLVIVLLIRAIFGGGSETPETQAPQLNSYANTNVVMRLSVWSQVEANQTHQQMRIDVSKYSSDIYLYNGYENTLVKNETFPSNPKAYTDFLNGLELAGYTKGNPDKALANWQGYCPFGVRYIYEIIDGAKTVQQYWSTSCGAQQPKTFLGNTTTVTGLYKAQIPDFSTFTQNTSFSSVQ